MAREVVTALEEHYPGIGADVEMVDVATPLTFERYTGNWKGSFEGWLITPENSCLRDETAQPEAAGAREFFPVRAVGGTGRRAADGGDVGQAAFPGDL